MALAHVFLDFGGTQARERRSRAALYVEAAASVGLALDEAAMARRMAEAHAALPRVIGSGAGAAQRYSDGWFRAFIERIFHTGLGLPRDALPGLEQQLFACFSDPTTFELFPGTLNLLRSLRDRGLGVGMISNWSPHLPELLEGLGLAEHLDPVLASASEGLEKPERALFERALEQAGIRSDQALHAGDHIDKDIRGARGAGLSAVLVDHGRHAADPRESERVESLEQLLRYILSICP